MDYYTSDLGYFQTHKYHLIEAGKQMIGLPVKMFNRYLISSQSENCMEKVSAQDYVIREKLDVQKKQ